MISCKFPNLYKDVHTFPTRRLNFLNLLQVQRLEDKFGRCDLVDVWCHITLEGIEYLQEEDCLVNGPVVDANPRLHIEGTQTKKPGFVELKKCNADLIQKLLKKRG